MWSTVCSAFSRHVAIGKLIPDSFTPLLSILDTCWKVLCKHMHIKTKKLIGLVFLKRASCLLTHWLPLRSTLRDEATPPFWKDGRWALMYSVVKTYNCWYIPAKLKWDPEEEYTIIKHWAWCCPSLLNWSKLNLQTGRHICFDSAAWRNAPWVPSMEPNFLQGEIPDAINKWQSTSFTSSWLNSGWIFDCLSLTCILPLCVQFHWCCLKSTQL